ncbi:MAG: hypothetical protein MI974_20320 [Chitinophagales bacterium]|nr:hypothetical protein [Chitinophagales bacterium]
MLQIVAKKAASFIRLDEDGNSATLNDQYYTYYSHDPHGNVEWIIQDDPTLGMKYLIR